MRAFAELLDRLVLTPQRNAKIKLMTDYFRATPDPDRGYALAAIAGALSLKTVKPNVLRQLVLERMDEVLFRYSYDYVGDLAETISLVWERPAGSAVAPADLSLGAVVRQLEAAGRANANGIVRNLLDQFEGASRYAFLKLITGGLRIGVSARLVKLSLIHI